MGTIPPVILTAQLRVYTPVVEAEVTLEPAVVLKVRPVNGPFGLVAEPMAEDAIVTRWKGQPYSCPRTPRLRVLEGVLAVRRAYGRLGGVSMISDDVVRAARDELEELQRDDPGRRSHILTSAWHVPLRWFVPFHPSERERHSDADGRPTVRYRAAMNDAVMRTEHAVEVLTTSGLPDTSTADVSELADWMAEFPASSMLELDYGEVARMLPEADLEADNSVADVWEAIDALDAGDWERAGEYYGEIVYRWTVPMAVAYSS